MAGALFLLLLTLLLGVITNTTTIASKASGQIEATRIARESFDLIGRDISTASLPWARTNTNSLQFLVNSSNYFNSMFWQAPIVRDATNTMGNLAIVGYFVLRDLQANGQNSRFQLRRVLIDPRSTNGDYTVYNTNTPWITDSTISTFGPATAALDNQNAQKGWLADGVLAMWVRCFDKTNGIITNAAGNGFDSRKGLQVTAKQWYPTNYSVLPAFVEVALVCVAPREIVKIKRLPANTVINPASATFYGDVSTYASNVRATNAGVKSVTFFTRKYRLYNSD